jgi:hypothetical protein
VGEGINVLPYIGDSVVDIGELLMDFNGVVATLDAIEVFETSRKV